MSSFSPIDLSTLPAPDVVETISYTDILAAMVADLQSRDPAFTALVESDPAWKILEVAAYREVLIRQRVNDAARGVMLAYAVGNDLDNLGAIFGTVRKTITAADDTTTPPTAAVMEADADFRYRITLALEGLSTAGPSGAYLYHALQVNGVADASVMGPYEDGAISPGNVKVTILGNAGNGTPTSDVLAAVNANLSSDDIRPLTDAVIVQAATILSYTIAATIYTAPGPDYSVVLANAQTSAQAYADAHHKLGLDVVLSGLYAALHVPGVSKVTLTSPTADVTTNNYQAAYCTGLALTWGGTLV